MEVCRERDFNFSSFIFSLEPSNPTLSLVYWKRISGAGREVLKDKLQPKKLACLALCLICDDLCSQLYSIKFVQTVWELNG